ncbi:MAG TPA: restriction endonuclease subunit M, partial [Caldithrix sp.]|nr:restriction endonuclease subunit M [Caldithrix sp.]
MTTPEKITNLVERFDRNLDAYKRGTYNETMVRREFIDPLFKELGWDVDNQQGFAEAYKDVVHEDTIKVGSATKAPDYCFRIGGVRKFFLEAKKPSVNIREEFHPAYQLRRYAWSAKLPLSILTDFEEFAVYDCRIRPAPTDKPGKARILYLTFREYPQRWEEIVAIFSKEAVLKGAFDRYVESTRGKRGTAEVGGEFLREIESWRELLARNIALRNPRLSVRELNYAVQKTIDRIIFLRICEDRGIESYGQLQALSGGGRIYPRMMEIFYHADEKYNSGLFHFREEKLQHSHPDSLTSILTIDDKVLNTILSRLYYPDCPYEFSVMPVEILGNVYEQFLGKVIRLTAGHQAKIEEKPEVRKAGGVYYTPKYIVDYIVKHTVGRLVEGKSPRQIEKLRILDPACGSGSFLLGAFQYLLDYHRDYYEREIAEKGFLKRHQQRVYQGRGGQYLLTTAEKKRILLNNIYGVDIDSQAVEVTKLSLLLKVLENENQDTLARQLKLWRERALPDLGSNIKCGNSLIGSDFYEGEQLNLFDEEERRRINAFDWETEFPEIIQVRGFDAVIGNPPWGADFSELELIYLRSRNRDIIVRMIDSFMYFVYQFSIKLSKGGFYGMILPDVLLYQGDNSKLREYLLKNFRINITLNMGNVFNKVTRPACILVFEKSDARKNNITISDLSKEKDKENVLRNSPHFQSLKQGLISDLPNYLFITNNVNHYQIFSKTQKLGNILLGNLVDKDGIQRGVSPDLKKAFLIGSREIEQYNLEREKLKPVVTGGKQVKRFHIIEENIYLIYTTRHEDFRLIPNICRFIDKFKKEIKCKEVQQKKHPIYSLHRARDEKIFLKSPKILGVITGDKIIVTLDDKKLFATDGLYLFSLRGGIKIKENYVLGILNSKFITFLYRLLALEKGRVLAQVKPTILQKLPIHPIDFSDPADKARHDRMVQLV